MCDEHTVRDNERFLAGQTGLSRRRFQQLAAGAALATLLPPVANAAEVTGSDVQVPTPDGMADCYFVHPTAGKHPGVIVWPDIMGLRPAFRMMGERLAQSGYAVLVVNQFYRSAKAPVAPAGASFSDESTRNLIMPMVRALSAETNMIDGRAFVEFLDQQAAVDTTRKIGSTGYCMGGPMTIRTAAAMPDRIGAIGSFHGGPLVTDEPGSPHLLIPGIKVRALFAIAANDDERQPEVKDVLRETFAEAGLPAEIEVYEGTLHGWCPPDSRVYNETQAERAWARLLVLFKEALA